MELVELGNDVFACLQEDTGLGKSNSGLVNRGGGLVVDTFWDLPHTRAMIDLYAQVWVAPAARVVNTHRNGDHFWGNQLFASAEIIGHRSFVDDAAKEDPAQMQALRDGAVTEGPFAAFAELLAEFDFRGVKVTPPTTLVDDSMEIELDGLRVELIHVGPAHTTGDLLVHLPEQRVVFAGDVLFRLCTPIGWEGTFAGWTRALDRINELDPEVIVPGHGPICGQEGPREMKEYLEFIRQESERCFAKGLSELEAAKQIDPGPYAGWTEPERIAFNVHRAYRELRGGAWDEPVDLESVYAMIAAVKQHRCGAAG
ncbi:MAG: MBL fold metallo-hydrolase [Deltaproteobacteria bacterium]